VQRSYGKGGVESCLMKRHYLILLLALLALGLIIAAAISVLHDGLSARAKPSALETAIARSARKMAVPSGARNTANPIVDSPATQKEGRLHFADHCAICHGNDGSGKTQIGRGLYPKPPDLRAAETQKLSDGEMFWIIENGVRLTGMPAFGGGDSGHGGKEASWKLVHFIRHLPALTTEERLEMEKYNPKGPDDRTEEQEEQDFLNGAPAKPNPAPAHHH
jgi:mono/diheme cytochrome c family protein